MKKLLASAAVAGIAGAGLTFGIGTTAATATAATVGAPNYYGPVTAAERAYDATWLQENEQSNLAEITLGHIAEARSHTPSTLQVAAMTIANHEQAVAQDKQLAAAYGITLPTSPNAQQQATAAYLDTMPLTYFDWDWDLAEIHGHEQSLAQTYGEIAYGAPSDIHTWSGIYKLVATGHLYMADAAYANVTRGIADPYVTMAMP